MNCRFFFSFHLDATRLQVMQNDYFFCTRGAAVIARMRRSAIVEIKISWESKQHHKTNKTTRTKQTRNPLKERPANFVEAQAGILSPVWNRKNLGMDELPRKSACNRDVASALMRQSNTFKELGQSTNGLRHSDVVARGFPGEGSFSRCVATFAELEVSLS